MGHESDRRVTPLKPTVIDTASCTPELKRRIIASLPCLAGLRPEALDRVEPEFREFGAAAGECIFSRTSVSSPVPAPSTPLSSTPDGTTADGGVLLQIPLTRDDLTSMAGTTTESASRELSTLEPEGVISTGRRWVSLRRNFFALD